MIKYLLFDLDRTLWDFDGNAAVTFRRMFRHFGLSVLCNTDFETFFRYYFQVNGVLWEGYRNGTVKKEVLNIDRFRLPLEHFGLHHCERLAQELGDYYVQEGVKQTGLMPGARQLLQYLQQPLLQPIQPMQAPPLPERIGRVPYPHRLPAEHPCTGEGERQSKIVYQLGIITNGFSEAQRPKMRTAGIYDYFQHIFLSEEIGFMKPDVRYFEAVLRCLHVRPEEVMVVGDDFLVDIAGAQAARMPQIYYNYASLPLPRGATPPTYEIRHLLDIEQILRT